MKISIWNRYRELFVNPTFAVSIKPEPKVSVFVFSDYISPNFTTSRGIEAERLALYLNKAVELYYGTV